MSISNYILIIVAIVMVLDLIVLVWIFLRRMRDNRVSEKRRKEVPPGRPAGRTTESRMDKGGEEGKTVPPGMPAGRTTTSRVDKGGEEGKTVPPGRPAVAVPAAPPVSGRIYRSGLEGLEDAVYVYAYDDNYKRCPFCDAEQKRDAVLCMVCGEQIMNT